jgi:hypothetical protein
MPLLKMERRSKKAINRISGGFGLFRLGES